MSGPLRQNRRVGPHAKRTNSTETFQHARNLPPGGLSKRIESSELCCYFN
jgi:hypothetical protein